MQLYRYFAAALLIAQALALFPQASAQNYPSRPKSQPDGYTLVIVSVGHVVNPRIYGNLSYDTIREFAGARQYCAT